MLIVLSQLIEWENTLSDYEHKSMASAFLSKLQDLERQCPDASNLLTVLAFFDPEGISVDMLIASAKSISQSKPAKSSSSTVIASLLDLIQSPIGFRDAITQPKTGP
jgi:hypothetical protein